MQLVQNPTSIYHASIMIELTKSVNTLPKYIMNCIDFNQFSKMTFKYLIKKVKDNL